MARTPKPKGESKGRSKSIRLPVQQNECSYLIEGWICDLMDSECINPQKTFSNCEAGKTWLRYTPGTERGG